MGSFDEVYWIFDGRVGEDDFRRALQMLTGKNVSAVELSALRQDELVPLVEQLDQLDLSRSSTFHFTPQVQWSSRSSRGPLNFFYMLRLANGQSSSIRMPCTPRLSGVSRQLPLHREHGQAKADRANGQRPR